MADTRIDELRRRLERDPGSRLFAQLAEEYRKAGNHADAIRVARAGLAQHPSYPSARLTLGRALLDSGDPVGARTELETALRDAPDNILASRFLGQALEKLGEIAPALLQLQRTLEMAPGDRQLASQIASLQARLQSGRPTAPPTPPAAAAPRPAPSPAQPPPVPAMPWDVTAPIRPSVAGGAQAEAREPVPPTVVIRAPGEHGARAPGPPPLPATAARTAATPPGPPPVPASPLAPTERLPASTSAVYESDLAPTIPRARSPEFDLAAETAVPTLPPGALATEETVFEPEPPPEPEPPSRVPVEEPRLVLERPPFARAPAGEAPAPAARPFSSSTLAELYLKQGLVERAVDVYRQLLVEEPGNERARSRLAEIERTAAADGRAARRRQLERTIAGLEALLAAVQRS